MTSDFTVVHLSSHVCVHHLGSLRPEKVVVVQINVGTCVRTYYPVYTCTPDESLKLKLHVKIGTWVRTLCAIGSSTYMLEE